MTAYINGKPVEFSENETILEVARRNGHFIPTLCEMADIHHTPGTCRVCLVDIRRKGDPRHHIVTSCNTPMETDMEILTRTREVREKQRLQVELLLADHDQDCATCIRHGACELQDAAQFVGLTHTRYRYPEFYGERDHDDSSPSISRDMSKCIRCFRCVTVCRNIQGIDTLVISEKGLRTEVSVRDALPLGTSDCVGCGQCVLVCPVGALAEQGNIEQVVDHLYDPGITTVFQFAPAVRTALGESFRMPAGKNVEGRIITALKHLGADVVLDTNFAADLVVMEEGTELLGRLQSGHRLPQFTSCCPAWINFVEKHYPQLIENLSTTKSPQQAFGAVAKTYLAGRMNIDPERLRVISIMPCTAKKDEAARPQMTTNGRRDVDVVLTTREFTRLLKRENIHLQDLEPSDYDNQWMGDYSGAGVIFGTTGGVMEAALRTVHQVLTGTELAPVELKAVRGMDQVREATVTIEDKEVHVAIAHSLTGARAIVEAVLAGEKEYDFIEVMACPGGCMGGGGQPRGKKQYQSSAKARRKGLYDIDRHSDVRQSHNNPLIQKLYEDFLGSPNSSRSHDLLHTHYTGRKGFVRHTVKEIWDEISESR